MPPKNDQWAKGARPKGLTGEELGMYYREKQIEKRRQQNSETQDDEYAPKKIYPAHSTLKLEKKCNFKSTKTHYLHFQKWQKKSIFAPEKSLKLPKMLFSDFLLVQKLIFLPYLKM